MSKKTSSISATARHLDLSRERLRQLEAEAVIERLPDGGYDLDETRRRYIRFLRDRPARSAKHDELHAARARLIELRVSKMRGELMDVRAALAFLEEKVIGPLFSGLAGVPATFCGRDVKERRRLEAIINQERNAFAAAVEREASALAVEIAKGGV